MRKEIKDFKDMKEINEADKKTLNLLRVFTHSPTPPVF